MKKKPKEEKKPEKKPEKIKKIRVKLPCKS